MTTHDPDFAPTDLTDGRKRGDWKSRYPDPAANRHILFEASYLAVLLFSAPILMLVMWLQVPNRWLDLSPEMYRPVMIFSLAWLGGLLGGTLFAIKWLYHSVAKETWHLDRRLWRLFTPHISSGLAFAIVVLISSGAIRILDQNTIESPTMVVSVAFLAGYFSDSTAAKLVEVFNTLFGPPPADPRTKVPNKVE